MNRRLSTVIVCVIILVAGVSYITSSAQEIQQDSTTPAPDGSQFIIEGATVKVPLEVAAAQQGTLAASTMSENFEGTWPGAGWQIIDQGSNDGGEYLWGKRNCHPRTGSFGGWFLGGGAQGSALACSANYPNNALSWARYGPVDLSHATSAKLTFYLWGTIETSQDCTKDSLISASSADGGTFTDGRAFCGDFTTGSAGEGYTQYILDLSNRLGQSQVWIGFFFISDDTITNQGITLDDITLDVTEGTASFSCNNVAEIPTTECAALIALYNSTTGLNWTNHIGWLATNTPCSWYGITCNAGHVTELFLYNNQLNGTIPSDLSNLQALQKLNLSFNGLNGNVPPQLGNLSNLLELTLAFNQLSGNVPVELSNLSRLGYLDLTSNQLSGTFLPTLSNLNRLSTLLLSKNQLSGNAPSELGTLVNLQFLYLDNNLFNGPLPGNLVNLTKLAHFWFQSTTLCEPGDAAFQAWLANIPDLGRTGVSCGNTGNPIITAIATGGYETCALTNSGGVKCWGDNFIGQLGDGTTTDRYIPVDVNGLNNGVTTIAVGNGGHACAVKSGGVKCWGNGGHGRLGDGTTTSRPTPVDVVGLSSGATAVATGLWHTCAMVNGGVKCWGDNRHGQLGDGTTITHTTPVDVLGLNSGVKNLAAGNFHTCALMNSGAVQCWGNNAYGQLGDGSVSGVTAIAASAGHTCALTDNGGVKCWGDNGRGELGDGTKTGHSTPVDVVGLGGGTTAITAGGGYFFYSCAVTSGGAKCWGSNDSGQLGDNTRTERLVPTNVFGLSGGLSNGIMAIHGGESHTCVVTSSGGVKCWGDNTNGQLGNGTTTNSLVPVDVQGLGEGVSTPTSTPTNTPIPTGTPTPPDTTPPPVPDGRVFTCIYSGTSGGVNNYQVHYRWNAVSDSGTVGMHQYPYWSQVSVKADFSIVPQPGWYNSWDNKLERSSDITFVENTTLYAHVRSRDAKDNQSGWSAIDSLILNSSNCSDISEPVILIPGIAGSQLRLPNEYLWPTFLDGPKLKMTLDPDKQNKGIYTDDVIRTYDAFNIPVIPPFHNTIYGPIIKRLSDAKYLEYKIGNDPNKRRLAGCDTNQKDALLFVFPWDWRFGVADAVDPDLSMSPNNVNLLAEYIGCIQKIHPGKKVNIIAHSMGGLLARNYILSYPDTHNIHRLISIDTPWLGAPKAISMMLTGDFKTEIIGKDTTRTLLEYFPGAHQLLPPKQYYDLLTSSDEYPLVALEGGIFNLEQYVNVTYPDFDKYLHSLYVSPEKGENYVSSVKFMGNNEKLYNNQEFKEKFADWNSEQIGVEYHILTGQTTIDDTIYRVIKTAHMTWSGDIYFIYDTRYTKGDKTVPEKSQTRLGNGKNLNGQVTTLHRFVGRKNESVEHGDMPSNTRVQDCILAILEKASSCDSDIINAAADATQPARYQRIWGIKSLQITDGVRSTANLMTSTLSLNIFPNITLDYLGDDSVLLIIADDKQYTVTAQANINLYIKSSFGTDANILQYESFESSSIVSGTTIALSTVQGNLATLNVDTDGDGVPELNIAPISSLSGNAANDSMPPTVSMLYDQFTKMLTIDAMDAGSGILKVFYSLDGITFVPYTEAVRLDPAQTHTVYAISQDKAGNWSKIIKTDILQVSATYPLYLPLITR